MDSSEMKWVIPHAGRDNSASDEYSAFDQAVNE